MMNERIKELIKQATEHDYTTWDSYNQKELVYYKFNQEKFAELIVRECVDLRTEIELVGLHSEDYEQGVWEGIQIYQNQIKRHFNIK